MAYIRATTKLPSGLDGWYIYYDTNGKMFILSPGLMDAFHTLDDVVVIRDILNECIKDIATKEFREKDD